ncbi:hypothetical protein JWS13_00870 (plasmid) [Rhodococcus pseudokoreensis]|uniref:Uncharacterized protein n=2 Tax=Rhodococcus TaxID=1827 RepID=A0ABT4NLA4_RHOOP|nr:MULTISPECIES: hypothetical protein [Rhodococcus]MCZ4588165.1 hypothetical protein [Rhodococcus opacus]QSE87269.1 hypothetical protein JWS13_00870 [Rhodococcus pseudokoreensis]
MDKTVHGVPGLVSRTTHIGVADLRPDTDTPGFYERRFNSAKARINLAVQK